MSIPIIFLCNKIDQIPLYRSSDDKFLLKILQEKKNCINLARKLESEFCECSALTQDGLSECFNFLMMKVNSYNFRLWREVVVVLLIL